MHGGEAARAVSGGVDQHIIWLRGFSRRRAQSTPWYTASIGKEHMTRVIHSLHLGHRQVNQEGATLTIREGRLPSVSIKDA